MASYELMGQTVERSLTPITIPAPQPEIRPAEAPRERHLAPVTVTLEPVPEAPLRPGPAMQPPEEPEKHVPIEQKPPVVETEAVEVEEKPAARPGALIAALAAGAILLMAQ